MKNETNNVTAEQVESYLAGVIDRVSAEQAAAGGYEPWLQEKAWEAATQTESHFPLVCATRTSAITEALKLATETNENVYVIPFTVGDFIRYRICLAAEVDDDGPKMVGYAEAPYDGLFAKPARFVTVEELVADCGSRLIGADACQYQVMCA